MPTAGQSSEPIGWSHYIARGNAACSMQRYDVAEQNFRNAVEEGKKCQVKTEKLAHAVFNLAWVCHQQGKRAEAEQFYLQALDLVEEAYGPDHPDVAIVASCLGRLYRETDKHQEAQPLFDRALHILEQYAL